VDPWLVARLLMRIMIAALVNNHRRGAQRATVTADGPQNQYAFEYAAVEEEGVNEMTFRILKQFVLMYFTSNQ